RFLADTEIAAAHGFQGGFRHDLLQRQAARRLRHQVADFLAGEPQGEASCFWLEVVEEDMRQQGGKIGRADILAPRDAGITPSGEPGLGQSAQARRPDVIQDLFLHGAPILPQTGRASNCRRDYSAACGSAVRLAVKAASVFASDSPSGSASAAVRACTTASAAASGAMRPDNAGRTTLSRMAR